MTSDRDPFDAPSLGLLALTIGAGIVRRLVVGVMLVIVVAVALATLFTIQLLHATVGGLAIGGLVLWILCRTLF